MMLEIRDMFKIHGTWIEASIEILPARWRWRRPWRLWRWWVEVGANTTEWPDKSLEESRGITHHYYTFDYSTLSLHRAWSRGYDVMWKLREYLEANPDDMPTSG